MREYTEIVQPVEYTEIVQPAITRSNIAIKTLEQGVKYVQS